MKVNSEAIITETEMKRRRRRRRRRRRGRNILFWMENHLQC